MKVVGQSPFRWTLFQQGRDQYVLSVLCGRVLQSGVELSLSAEEIRAYEEAGDAPINALADAVYANPDRYEGRAIKGFFKQVGWREALKEWSRRTANG